MTNVPWPLLPGRTPASVASAEGAYFNMKDGRRVLDAAGGAVVASIGHGRKEVADAIHAAVMNATYLIPPWLTPEREALVDELTGHWLPDYLTRIHLCSGGSESNESALKIAIQYHASRGEPDRNIILARDLSYHGTTISTAAVSGHPGRKRGLETFLQDFPRIATPYPLRCPLGPYHPDTADYYVQSLIDTIERVGANNIAALIAEPLNGSSGGAITPPENYWNRVQKILKDNGILLVIDEVMTGFGRCGEKFGIDLYDIRPDILAAGKGLAAGYAPIGGVYTTDEVARSIADAGLEVMFHTYAALPQSCAAAATVLGIVRRESLVHRSKTLGAALKERLQSRFGQHPNVAEIRGEGMFIGIEVVRDRETLERFATEDTMTSKMIAAGMKAGAFFYPGGTGEVRDILCIGAPFTIGEPEMDIIETALAAALAVPAGTKT